MNTNVLQGTDFFMALNWCLYMYAYAHGIIRESQIECFLNELNLPAYVGVH